MSKLKLTFGCWNYDRTRAIQDGSVQPDGIDINYQLFDDRGVPLRAEVTITLKEYRPAAV